MKFNKILTLLEEEAAKTGLASIWAELKDIVGKYRRAKQRDLTQYVFDTGHEKEVLAMLKRRFKGEEFHLNKFGEYVWELKSGEQVRLIINPNLGCHTLQIFE